MEFKFGKTILQFFIAIAWFLVILPINKKIFDTTFFDIFDGSKLIKLNNIFIKIYSNNSLELQKGTTREIKNKNFTKKFIKQNMDISTLLQKN